MPNVLYLGHASVNTTTVRSAIEKTVWRETAWPFRHLRHRPSPTVQKFKGHLKTRMDAAGTGTASWICAQSNARLFRRRPLIPNFKTDLHGSLTMTVDRATCCLSANQQEDICGRKNCTFTCTEPEPSIPELESDPANFSRDRAFFIETSGSGGLSVRQACAVESLALHNPNLTVYVLFVNVKINTSLDTVQELEKKYNNVHLISINLDDYMAGTALEHWYHCSDWRNGFYVNNLSNGLRLLTLSKYGGYYFDLDIISVRPVTYYRNFVAAQDGNDVNNDVIHADLNNPVIQLAIKDFIINFKPDVWGHNGPSMILRVLQNWCNVGNLTSMDYVTCRGFNVLPTSSFHPVHYSKMNELFIRRMANETDGLSDWLTEKVVGVHIWNKLSKDQPIYKNSTQDYNRLARDHCPANFAIAPETF